IPADGEEFRLVGAAHQVVRILYPLEAGQTEAVARCEGIAKFTWGDVAGADVRDLARFDDRSETFQRRLDGGLGIRTVRQAKVDVIQAQSFQTAVEMFGDGPGGGVHSNARGRDHRSNLGGDPDPLSRFAVLAREPTADHPIARTAGIAERSVEQRDAERHRLVHGGKGSGFVKSAPNQRCGRTNPAERPATKRYAANLDARLSKLPILHRVYGK